MKKRVFFTARKHLLYSAAVLLCTLASSLYAASPQTETPRPNFDLNDPQQRQAFVDNLRERRRPGIERAAEYLQQTGKPKRWFDGKNVCELMSIEDDGQFIVYTTCNANSAISIAADIVRDDPYFGMTGNGIAVGLWDAGTARLTHQELIGRVIWKDLAAQVNNYHSTAVAGTIAATGVDPLAKGMAPLAQIWSYEWNSDASEMAAVAMSSPGQAGTIQISNHSYGTICGWYNDGQWKWYGNSAYRESNLFGCYNAAAASFDQICDNAPYYLPIRAVGNDRGDSGIPADGTTYYINGTTAATFYAASGPYADNYDNGGFDTLLPDACAKNVLSIGSVDDAVTDGIRDLSKASSTYLSAWGPTDDGRIKPDLVTNGYGVYSCNSASDTSYQTLTGTSLAAPAAAGVAAQILGLYSQLFPGQYMRSSTLKALMIHTADDLGNAGPDYKFGWGLINAKAAAEKNLLHKRNIAMNPKNIIEDSLKHAKTTSNDNLTDVFTFTWDGYSPIRATLCWTDPAGTATSTLDSPTKKLVHNLDLGITAPDGTTIYYPFVLDPTAPDTPATTGLNNTDNVEQVLIALPTQQGQYTIKVLFNNPPTARYGDIIQDYSLIISGQAQLSVYDIDGDGAIGLGDLTAMANSWMTNTEACDIYPAVGDGNVDLLDFALLSQFWMEP